MADAGRIRSHRTQLRFDCDSASSAVQRHLQPQPGTSSRMMAKMACTACARCAVILPWPRSRADLNHSSSHRASRASAARATPSVTEVATTAHAHCKGPRLLWLQRSEAYRATASRAVGGKRAPNLSAASAGRVNGMCMAVDGSCTAAPAASPATCTLGWATLSA